MARGLLAGEGIPLAGRGALGLAGGFELLTSLSAGAAGAEVMVIAGLLSEGFISTLLLKKEAKKLEPFFGVTGVSGVPTGVVGAEEALLLALVTSILRLLALRAWLGVLVMLLLSSVPLLLGASIF